MKFTRGLVRRRRSASEVERLVAEFRASGLSVARFAADQGVAPGTVYLWLRACPEAGPALVPVRVTPPAGGGAEPIRLVHPSGWRVEFPSGLAPSALASLLNSLGSC